MKLTGDDGPAFAVEAATLHLFNSAPWLLREVYSDRDWAPS